MLYVWHLFSHVLSRYRHIVEDNRSNGIITMFLKFKVCTFNLGMFNQLNLVILNLDKVSNDVIA